MAMLAETRSKRRKFNGISPKANANWAQDSNSIGLKLIQKMGWSEGKGLGVDESGVAQPLRLNYKNDLRGLGCLNLEGDMAVAQQKDFDALLANLSQGEPEMTEESSDKRTPKSLEKMSQKSRARVHYHKFTRGKDLSRASSKDLASILGIAESKTNSIEQELEKVVPAVGPVLEYNPLKSCGSSADYFKRKMEEKKSRGDIAGEVNNDEEKSSGNSGSDEEENPRSNTSILNTTHNESISNERRKSVTWGDVEVSFVSKYIKDMVDTSTESVNDDSSDVFLSVEADEEIPEDVTQKKKKKKNKRKNKDMPESAAEDTMSNNVDSVSECDESLDTQNSKKKKKRKMKKDIDVAETIADNSADCSPSLESSVLENATPKKKKKKSKDKHNNSDESPNAVETVEDRENEASSENDTSKSKSKKEKKLRLANTKLVEEVYVEDEPQSKKEKKKEKLEKKKLNNLASNDDSSAEIVEVDLVDPEKATKSNKKRKRIDVEDPQEVEVVVEKKKKKKKNKNKDAPEAATVDEEEKKSNAGELNIEAYNSSTEPSSQPVLSELTQERMEKWKKRKEAKAVKTSDKEVTAPSENTNSIAEKSRPSQVTSNTAVLNYSYKRVLAALGHDVKACLGKKITINFPSTDIPGSSLDKIPGYGV